MLNTVCVFVNNVYLFHPCSGNPFYVVLLSLCSSYIKHNIYSSANGGIKVLQTYIPKLPDIYYMCCTTGYAEL